LGHGSLDDAETGDIEALKEDLAGAFVYGAREPCGKGEDDGRFVLYASDAETVEEDVFPDKGVLMLRQPFFSQRNV
jgi:hypothetical protein